MLKKMCIICCLAVGLILMFLVSFVYGFTETTLPGSIYMLLWLLCMGIVYYASRELER